MEQEMIDPTNIRMTSAIPTIVADILNPFASAFRPEEAVCWSCMWMWNLLNQKHPLVLVIRYFSSVELIHSQQYCGCKLLSGPTFDDIIDQINNEMLNKWAS